jgi:hypothetical protein
MPILTASAAVGGSDRCGGAGGDRSGGETDVVAATRVGGGGGAGIERLRDGDEGGSAVARVVEGCEGGGDGCGAAVGWVVVAATGVVGMDVVVATRSVALCGSGGGGVGSERLREGDDGSTAARAGEGCKGSGGSCVGAGDGAAAGCAVGCGVVGCCAVAATGASPLRRWYAALRSKLRCCRALRAGCERGSVDERLVEGGRAGGDVCDARCARGARAR